MSLKLPYAFALPGALSLPPGTKVQCVVWSLWDPKARLGSLCRQEFLPPLAILWGI